MKNEVRYILFIAVLALVGAGIFLLGRGCGIRTSGANFGAEVKQLKEELAESARRAGEIKEDYIRERELASTLAEQYERISRGVDGIAVTVSSVEKRFEEQREYIDKLAELNSGAGESLDTIGTELDASISIVNGLIEETSSGNGEDNSHRGSD